MLKSRMHPITLSVLRTAVLITVLATIPAAAIVMKLKTDRLSGDGPSYLDIAQSVASGNGFQEPHWLWPGLPTSRRPPLWPLVLSPPLKLWSTSNPMSVMYATEVVLHALTIFCTAFLAWMLSGSWRRTVLASLIVALWPGGQAYMVAGLSEPCSPRH
jgi:4-amino-4-deoxy-L-arabinose transferase-like glycosyltransferase